MEEKYLYSWVVLHVQEQLGVCGPFAPPVWLCASLWVLLFGVHWDMPKWMVDFLACWKRYLINTIVLIHGGLFHCVMWTVWREWNQSTLFLIRGWALVCGAKIIFIMFHLWLNDCFEFSLLFSLEHFLDLCKFRWLL